MIRLALVAVLLTMASVFRVQEGGNIGAPVDAPRGLTKPYTCTSCAARKQRLKGGQALRKPRSDVPRSQTRKAFR
ncbi:hypothetical protein ACSSV4_004269 [Roseovarius sp. MBR-154]|jgi:hypothetical protein